MSIAAMVAVGCYTYTPLERARPEPGTELSIAVTDQGRVAAASLFGPSVDRVEGSLIDTTDTTWRLRVARVIDIHGAVSKWTAEPVTLERAWVASASRRRFSRLRTYVLAGAFTAAVTAYVATKSLGQGGPVLQSPGGTGGGNGQ